MTTNHSHEQPVSHDQANPNEPSQETPVFDAGSFTIDHLSPEEGFTFTAQGVGRTAILREGLDFDDSTRRAIRGGVWNEMKFAGLPAQAALARRRVELHGKDRTDEEQAELDDLAAEVAAKKDSYRGLGLKIGLRDLTPDETDPSHLKANAMLVPFFMYDMMTPEKSGTKFGDLSEAAGVAMAIVTEDNRLIIQHRAVEHIGIKSSAKKPGNGNYADIPGASAAGWIDASRSNPDRTSGAPDDVTTDTLLAGIRKEMGEELGLSSAEVDEVKIVGIAHDNIKPHSEVLHLARTGLTADEVRESSRQSLKNKNLSDEDLAEKFTDIEASPEAIETLLTEVKCPLPPTHAAVYIACGYNMMLERSDKATADTWLSDMEAKVEQNYAEMNRRVEDYYQRFPEAATIVPERYWGKNAPARNLRGYDPRYTPSEQGLPSLEDELERTGLAPEREAVDEIFLYDVDGVITNPQLKEIMQPEIIDAIAKQIEEGAVVSLNTGRSTKWVEDRVVPLIAQKLTDPAHIHRLSIVGEKGNTWTGYEADGSAYRGQSPKATIPAELQAKISELTEQFADIMGNHDPKSTMASIEMNDGLDIADYQKRREPFVEALKGIIASNREWAKLFKVDATTIAVDVESPHAGKAHGADRVLQILDAMGLNYANAGFETFGDSGSDIAMAEELTRRGLEGTFVYVGDKPDSLADRGHFPIINQGGFDAGTSQYLSNR